MELIDKSNNEIKENKRQKKSIAVNLFAHPESNISKNIEDLFALKNTQPDYEKVLYEFIPRLYGLKNLKHQTCNGPDFAAEISGCVSTPEFEAKISATINVSIKTPVNESSESTSDESVLELVPEQDAEQQDQAIDVVLLTPEEVITFEKQEQEEDDDIDFQLKTDEFDTPPGSAMNTSQWAQKLYDYVAETFGRDNLVNILGNVIPQILPVVHNDFQSEKRDFEDSRPSLASDNEMDDGSLEKELRELMKNFSREAELHSLQRNQLGDQLDEQLNDMMRQEIFQFQDASQIKNENDDTTPLESKCIPTTPLESNKFVNDKVNSLLAQMEKDFHTQNSESFDRFDTTSLKQTNQLKGNSSEDETLKRGKISSFSGNSMDPDDYADEEEEEEEDFPLPFWVSGLLSAA